jgi:hypothetical protein
MQIPVLVISLARAAERRAAIARRLAALGVTFSFVDAVDGRAMSRDDIDRLAPRYFARVNRHTWFPGELGNQASFQKALGIVASGDSEMVCVLEDDAEPTPHFPRFLALGALEALPPFDILRLEGSWTGRHLPLGRLDAIAVVAPYRLGPLACAQVFTRRAARDVLRRMIPSRGTIDCTVYMDRRFINLRILDVNPTVVVHPGTTSFIEEADPRVRPIGTLSDSIRQKLFRAGCDIRTWLGFTRQYGWSARRNLIHRSPDRP